MIIDGIWYKFLVRKEKLTGLRDLTSTPLRAILLVVVRMRFGVKVKFSVACFLTNVAGSFPPLSFRVNYKYDLSTMLFVHLLALKLWSSQKLYMLAHRLITFKEIDKLNRKVWIHCNVFSNVLKSYNVNFELYLVL